jgi:hypothetical protein
MIQSYPSIYNLGHKAVAEIFAEPVVVQEKVDGSQVSFGVYPEGGCTVAEAEWKERVIAKFRTPARWAKAVQHLREDGKLEDSPRDIALLFKEVPADVLRECEQEIKQELFDLAWPKVHRGVTAGLAEWYKERLLERQFEDLQEQALRTTADEPPSESAYRTMGSGNCGMDR